jgi:excisionase family DNA binding protein
MREVSRQQKPTKSAPRTGEPDTLTIEETAKRLRIGLNSAYSGVKNGQIPSIRIGRRILIPRPALEALLAGATRPEPD